MEPHPQQSKIEISRRTAITGLGASGIGLAIAASTRPAAAQDAAAAMTGHPIVGTWVVTTSQGTSIILLGADGSVVQGFPASQPGPQGAQFVGGGLGVWEPTGDRSAAFTAVTILTDATGALTGTTTFDGNLAVSTDGQTWIDDWSAGSTVTVRDAGGNVVTVIGEPGLPPITAVRMHIHAPGLP